MIFAWLNAETGLLQLGKKSVTITTQQVAMDATPLAVWNVDTIALLEIRALVLLHHVETESVQALNCATTATLRVAMDAALPARLKQDGNASLIMIASIQLAFGSKETKCVETARLSGQNRISLISVMMATLPTTMDARPVAKSSADTTATAARRLLSTLVTQGAETGSLLATRHATTATMLMGMDAVRTALLQRTDGHARASRVVYRFALKFVETGSSRRERGATMATREMVMGATQHARSSADSTALEVTQACARQGAETVRSLATRHATMATMLMGMDAVRLAQL